MNGIMASTLCPVAGCLEEKGRGHVMCALHWRSIPESVRRAVAELYRVGRGRKPKAFVQAVGEAVKLAEFREFAERNLR